MPLKLADVMHIACSMSNANIQSRIITNFVNVSRLIDTSNNTVQGFVIDLQCNGFKEIFKQVKSTFFNYLTLEKELKKSQYVLMKFEKGNPEIMFNNFNLWLLIYSERDNNMRNEKYLSVIFSQKIPVLFFSIFIEKIHVFRQQQWIF